MKSIIILLILLFIGNITFAQKLTHSDTTLKRNQNVTVNENIPDKKDQKSQEVHITPGSSSVKRGIGYKFSALSGDGDPGAGVFRYNNSRVASVTSVFVDNIDISGEDETQWYSTWDQTTGASARGKITIADQEGKIVTVFNITGLLADRKGYWKIPVEYVTGQVPVDGSVYYYVFDRIAHSAASGKTSKDENVNLSNQGNQGTTVIAGSEIVIASQANTSTQGGQVSQENRQAETPQTTQQMQQAETPHSTQQMQQAETPQTTQQMQQTETPHSTQQMQQADAPQKAPVTQSTPTTLTTQTTQEVQRSQDVPVYQQYQATPGSQFPVVYNYQMQSVARRKWYRGIIELGYGFGVGEYGMNNFRFNFINGIKIGPYFSIGLGIGYRHLYAENQTDRYLASSTEQIPVFIDFRTTFTAKKVTPYLALGYGGASGIDETETDNGGLLFNASGGIWYNVSDRFAVFAGIAYEMQKLEFSETNPYTNNYKKNANSISFNIGISF